MMHLSPLTGIETTWSQSLISMLIWCIFHPLRGLKPLAAKANLARTIDASFTPYGDWNEEVQEVACDAIAMHLSPLTGIETIFPSQSSIGRAWMHLSPLTGIETVVSHVVARKPQNDASFTPYGDWNCRQTASNLGWMVMHLSPLTGIETSVEQMKFPFKYRCIFHPLRGLKLRSHDQNESRDFDASFTPYGDWNHFVLISDGYQLFDASFTPYGDWNCFLPVRLCSVCCDASFTPYGDWNWSALS